IPSWANINPQNSTRFVATAITTAGEAAMNDPVSAVMARPPHIHPYTARRNVVTRSSTERDALKGVSGVISKGAISDSLVCAGNRLTDSTRSSYYNVRGAGT